MTVAREETIQELQFLEGIPWTRITIYAQAYICMPSIQVSTVPVPKESAVNVFCPAPNLADAFSVGLPADATDNPKRLARFLFAQQPAWIRILMGIRDAMVVGLGIKTTKQFRALEAADPAGRIGIFRVFGEDEFEIVLGEDDAHLDFRVSVRVVNADTLQLKRQVVVSSVVHCHNRLGRVYLGLIAPFHRVVVRTTLRRAAKAGWRSN